MPMNPASVRPMLVANTFWESNPSCYFPTTPYSSDSLATVVRRSNVTATVIDGTLNMLIRRDEQVSTLVVASSADSDVYIPDMIYPRGVYALWQDNLILNGTGTIIRPENGPVRNYAYTYPTQGKSYYTADGGCLGETSCGGEEYFDGKYNPSTGQTDAEWNFAWGLFSTMDISYLANMSWAVPFGVTLDEGAHPHCQEVTEGFRFQHKVRFEYSGVYAGSPRSGKCKCETFCDQCAAY
ncbi:hypothetical protein BJ741DRAFT_671036 [Chytriomyces cf. hyalinus JEL632]|nr:hypothetical protein BJ741DRAFT_671036 [Chytriomyces cf. hyalinus JEL632]